MDYVQDDEGQWWAYCESRRFSVSPRTCENCGEEYVKYAGGKIQRFCSRKCAGEAIGEEARAKRTNYTCERCGEDFWPKDLRSTQFCSRSCSGAARRGKRKNPDEAARECPVCGSMFSREVRRPWRKTCGDSACKRAVSWPSGEAHPNYKDGKSFTQGYVRVGGRLEHRVVMEELLGRPLERFEEVHHRNAIRHDNRPENLELWVKRQPGGARAQDLIDYAHWVLDTYGPVEDKLRV